MGKRFPPRGLQVQTPHPFPSRGLQVQTPHPLTADEREGRLVRYLLTLHRGELEEFRLSRLNRVANFRKALKELLEEFIEARAENLAAGMIAEHARPAPRRRSKARLPAVSTRRMPEWVVR